MSDYFGLEALLDEHERIAEAQARVERELSVPEIVWLTPFEEEAQHEALHRAVRGKKHCEVARYFSHKGWKYEWVCDHWFHLKHWFEVRLTFQGPSDVDQYETLEWYYDHADTLGLPELDEDWGHMEYAGTFRLHAWQWSSLNEEYGTDSQLSRAFRLWAGVIKHPKVMLAMVRKHGSSVTVDEVLAKYGLA